MNVFIELMRPHNCLMAGLAAIIGLLIAGGRGLGPTLLIFLVVLLITGAGNVVNDYFDRLIDEVNRPSRPIPSGRATPRSALLWSITLFALGCLLAGLLGWLSFAFAVANSVILYFYARDLKATPLIGNICVAYLTGSTFLFGGSIYGVIGMRSALIPFWLSALATMSREIMKDVEDIRGDDLAGAKTLPILAGDKVSGALAAIFALIAVILSYQPGFGVAYLAIMAPADIFLLASIWKIIKADASGSQKALKMGMAVALAAFLAAALKATA